MKNFLRKLFKPKPPKQLLQLGAKIRISRLYLDYANVAEIPQEGLFCFMHELNAPVTITKASTLIFQGNDKSKIYFKVKNPFFACGMEAPDNCIVWFTIERFNNHLIYKKV